MMRGAPRPHATRRRMALAAMAVAWILFGVYLVVDRHPQSKYPPPDHRATIAIEAHLEAAPQTAFGEPSVADLRDHARRAE